MKEKGIKFTQDEKGMWTTNVTIPKLNGILKKSFGRDWIKIEEFVGTINKDESRKVSMVHDGPWVNLTGKSKEIISEYLAQYNGDDRNINPVREVDSGKNMQRGRYR
jgi:hypothetical protein